MIKSRIRLYSVGVAALLLGTVAVTGNPRSTPTITASAVVDAPILRIASPFDGLVDHAPPSRGTVVHPGDMLVRVKATPHRGRYLADLKSRLASTQRQLIATTGHAAALSDARSKLTARMEKYRTGIVARLAAQLSEAEALHNIFKARLGQSGDALDRQKQLKTKGYASQANFDAATASATVAKSDVAASAARIQRIRVELASAKKGVFVGDNRDDVPYSQQRDDEIMLRLVELNATAANLHATVSDLQDQITAEANRQASGDIYQQNALVTGVVWDATNPKGTPVRAGDTLVNVLDCSRAFLEVTLPESQATGIKPGDAAAIRLADDVDALDGTVRALRGATDTANGDTTPGTDSQLRGQMTILVDLPAATDRRSMDNFCHVGRVATVVFDGSTTQSATGMTAAAKPAQGPTPVAAQYPLLDPQNTARN